jgi:hypothetical protein
MGWTRVFRWDRDVCLHPRFAWDGRNSFSRWTCTLRMEVGLLHSNGEQSFKQQETRKKLSKGCRIWALI